MSILKYPTESDIEMREMEYYKDVDIWIAAEFGALGRVKKLLDKGVDVNARSGDYDNTPLIMACKYGCDNVVQYLLDNGAGIDMVDCNGWSALMYAAFYGYESTVNILLDHGADINIRDRVGGTALVYVSKPGGNKYMVYLLRQHGAE